MLVLKEAHMLYLFLQFFRLMGWTDGWEAPATRPASGSGKHMGTFDGTEPPMPPSGHP
jgi:hypothetical protein